MTPLKKFLYYFTGFVTFMVLLQLPFAFAVSNVFSSPDNIDKVLADGGVYKNFVELALQNAEEQADENTKKLLADEKIKEIITSSIQPDDIQNSSKSVISGGYAWLEGKTTQPEFTIDLSKPAETAVTKLSAYAEERASSLPTCTVQQLQTVDFQSDFLSMPCLPPGVTSSQIGQQFGAQAKDQVEFLKNPVISSQEALKEVDTTSSKFTDAPKAYQNLHQSKWYNLLFVFILLAALIFARKDRNAGLRFASKLVFAAGLVLAFILLLFMSGNSGTSNVDDKVSEVFLGTLMSLLGQLALTLKWFAVGYLILGVGGIYLTKRLTAANDTPQDTQPPVVTS